MNIILLASLFFLGFSAHADVTTIHSFNKTFIKFSNSQVGYLLTSPSFNLKEGQAVEVELDQNNNIITLTPVKGQKLSGHSSTFINDLFEPTILPGQKNARNLLNHFRGNTKEDSQCYDRAHIWTYEAKLLSGTKLMKGWIFFSDQFIAKKRFRWWFHVAPLALIENDSPKILDKEFSSRPLGLKEWTDLFMEGKPCREVEKYTDYSWHPGEEDCYLIRSTPYFWQPRDLEAFALSGEEKTDYVQWEVDWAYKNGFGIILNN